MSGFIEGESRSQAALSPEGIDGYIAKENAFRAVYVIADEPYLSYPGLKALPKAIG
jgi:hypothetical protein